MEEEFSVVGGEMARWPTVLSRLTRPFDCSNNKKRRRRPRGIILRPQRRQCRHTARRSTKGREKKNGAPQLELNPHRHCVIHRRNRSPSFFRHSSDAHFQMLFRPCHPHCGIQVCPDTWPSNNNVFHLI